MVEGPGVHRVAIAHRKLFVGKRLRASSPNGKFVDGAALVDCRTLALIEAHGKNIFYFFTHSEPSDIGNITSENLPEDAIVVHIHFGMSGSFQTYNAPGPEPRSATRLKLVAEKEGIVAHLSANLCNHGNIEFYREKVKCLGPDPLRRDADKERLWVTLQKSKMKIGAVLMNQSLIAGIGNIYRTELLFVIGVHPNQPASSVTRCTFERLWSEACRLLQVGVLTGQIITVSSDEAGKPFSKLRKGEKRYIYNHKLCRRCDGSVQSWKLAQRTVFACDACQPLMLQVLTTQGTEDETMKVHIVVKDCDKMVHNHVIVHERSQDPERSEVEEFGQTLQGHIKRKACHKHTRVKRLDRTVEHQAFKDITTGGIWDFGPQIDDCTLQNLAPTTPEKRYAADGTTKCYKRRKISVKKDNS